MRKKFLLALAISLLFVTPVYGQADDNTNPIEDTLLNRFNERLYYVTDTTIKYTTAHVNIRKYPSTNAEILDVSLVNTEFEVVLELDGWAMITTQDGYAFMKNDWFSDEPVTELIPLGEFKVSHYCIEPYKHICGNGSGLTQSGNKVHVGSLSVDPSVIPLGSTIVINGQEYIAEDTGGAIKGKKIDMAVASHKEALSLGVYYADVYLKVQ